MLEKMIIHKTPHSTVRVWVYFMEKYPDMSGKIPTVFNYLSIWGGEDENYLENDKRVLSYELKESLIDFLKEKYQYNPDVDMSGLGK